PEERAFAWPARHRDRSAVGFGKFLRNGQSQASTLGFRGVEWHKDLSEPLRRDPNASVADLRKYTDSTRLVLRCTSGQSDDPTTGGKGFRRVANEAHKDLLEEDGIPQSRRQDWSQTLLYHQARPRQAPSHHTQSAVQHCMDIQGFTLPLGRSGELQQLLETVFQTIHLGHDIC